MQLFVGLGNPGGKYARNRHNIGFMAVERIAADHGFGPWRGKFQGAVSEGVLGGEKVLLLKPETFMNRSGQSVGEAARFYKVGTEAITVFHDELDLAPGRLKVKQGGGHAGHNGLRSIHGHMGEAYRRVRLGIGHPGHKDAVPGYVLRDFPKADDGWLDDLLRGISEGAAELARGDAGRFMNAVAQRTAPPRASTGTQGKAARQRPPQPHPPQSQTPQRAAPAAEKKPAPKPAEAPGTQHAPDARSALQKLVDRFR